MKYYVHVLLSNYVNKQQTIFLQEPQKHKPRNFQAAYPETERGTHGKIRASWATQDPPNTVKRKERTKVLETMDSKGVIPQLTKEENQHSEKLQHPKCHEKQQS